MYFNRAEIDKVSGITEYDFVLQSLIQENCRKMNTLIGCYDWEDNKMNDKYKTLVLYSSERIYKFNIRKKILSNLSKFEKKFIKFIRKTVKS